MNINQPVPCLFEMFGSRNHSCWCHSSLRHQVISSYGTDFYQMSRFFSVLCREGYSLSVPFQCVVIIWNSYTFSNFFLIIQLHYIISAMASQIPGASIVYSAVCSGADQSKHQSSASLAFVRGIHWWPVNSPHKGPVTRKMFPFDDVIMSSRVHERHSQPLTQADFVTSGFSDTVGSCGIVGSSSTTGVLATICSLVFRDRSR